MDNIAIGTDTATGEYCVTQESAKGYYFIRGRFASQHDARIFYDQLTRMKKKGLYLGSVFLNPKIGEVP